MEDDDILAVDEALAKLSEIDPEGAELVKMHFFIGLTWEEVATVTGRVHPGIENFVDGALAVGNILRHSHSHSLITDIADSEKVFQGNRSSFGKNRQKGSRPMRGAEWGELRIIRDLRKTVIKVPAKSANQSNLNSAAKRTVVPSESSSISRRVLHHGINRGAAAHSKLSPVELHGWWFRGG